MRSDEALAFFDQLMDNIERDPVLRREFADYQSNTRPGELRREVPKLYDELVLKGDWTDEDLTAAVVGVVCQRMGLRRKTLTMVLGDESLQQPNPKFAKKKANRSPGFRRWQERQQQFAADQRLQEEDTL